MEKKRRIENHSPFTKEYEEWRKWYYSNKFEIQKDYISKQTNDRLIKQQKMFEFYCQNCLYQTNIYNSICPKCNKGQLERTKENVNNNRLDRRVTNNYSDNNYVVGYERRGVLSDFKNLRLKNIQKEARDKLKKMKKVFSFYCPHCLLQTNEYSKLCPKCRTGRLTKTDNTRYKPNKYRRTTLKPNFMEYRKKIRKKIKKIKTKRKLPLHNSQKNTPIEIEDEKSFYYSCPVCFFKTDYYSVNCPECKKGRLEEIN